MRILLIGSSGRIGSQILKEFQDHEIISPERKVYSEWHNIEQIKNIQRYVEVNNIESIFVCSGIMNSSENERTILDVNFFLPANIIEATRSQRTRIIMFGTVMEDIAPDCNEYVRSKQRLQEFINREIQNERFLSLKIHTIYGGSRPNEYMFLGQILKSLKNQVVFNMSSGSQLREYHHVEDLVLAIKQLFINNISGIQHLSVGNPIKLKDLATYIFEYFGARSNLKIGSIPHNNLDNFSNILPSNSLIEEVRFRDPYEGITQYLEKYLK